MKIVNFILSYRLSHSSPPAVVMIETTFTTWMHCMSVFSEVAQVLLWLFCLGGWGGGGSNPFSHNNTPPPPHPTSRH